MRILLVEDEPAAAHVLAKGLREQTYAVDLAGDGDAAVFQVGTTDYDAVLLDVMLPGRDGFAVCRSIRESGCAVPILMVTARDAVEARIEGLDCGADDYLVKPFAFAELLARIHALARRPPMAQIETVLKVADLEMDLMSRKVHRAGQDIELQPREFRLLEYLLRNAGRVVTRTMLLENVWDFHFDPKTNIVETHISRLRSKIDRHFAVELIETVRGSGYRIRAHS
jgi:two-component system OmpR family response regulator